ncbi:Mrp/NBP35 family ATP-binding protein [Methylobrevis pamukkalensis]|uniref:Iron-sulfur cluster carrier protein n=1 Tax=Methylobrevis pamukkalensis TaxID=1439726 RepID=A0A1E3GXA2_9HYPH|nr:Mrp/NBP35 family ATP-binding protein [Methylobrevis pamukkalensis]ODN68682.1 Septum site-determining protein MinD [Methylobrevis pamukkalensis]
MAVTREDVLARLSKVTGPDGRTDVVSLGIVSDIFIAGGKVMFSLTVPAERARDLEMMRAAAEKVVRSIPGVEKATVMLTAERRAGSAPAQPVPRPAPGGNGNGHSHAGHSHAGHSHAGHSHAPAGQPPAQTRGVTPQKPAVPGVRHIVAVASGKGGVGKSTTAVNIAVGLKALGLSVGILDADIYGPSLPRLLGLSGRPEIISGRTMKPMEGHGLKVMSMGFLVEEETPMIWRGPMVMSALSQMLREVAWGDLDVLVVDMPPGTGDAQLTMAQQVPLAGAVIVSTPQDLALLDARKGLNMFRKVEVPVLGIVENMSYFLCPDCGGRHDIFGHGGARKEAERLGVPFLGEVPLHMSIRENSDAGTPVAIAEPGGVHAGIYAGIAAEIVKALEGREAGARRAPRIVID